MTTATESFRSGNSSSNRLERLLFFGLLVVIAGYGFVGVDWDYRTVPEAELPSAARGFSAPRPSGPVEPGEVVISASAMRGEGVFQANGCYACHSVDGSKKIGPSLLGVWEQPQELEDGSVAIADRDYVLESITYPQAKLVSGYASAQMPAYLELINEDDLSDLVDYLETLR